MNLKMAKKKYKMDVHTTLNQHFMAEIQKIKELLGVDPVRKIPEKILLEEIEIKKGYRAGSIERGRSLIISRGLPEHKIEAVLKREAFITFLPKVDFPQIYDLAWAYSGAEPRWWGENSLPVVDSLYYYAPARHLPLLNERDKEIVIKALTLYIRKSSEVEFDEFFSIYSLLLIRFLFHEISDMESKILKAIARGMMKLDEISRSTKLSKPTISRHLKSLRNKGIIFGPYNVNISAIGLQSVMVRAPYNRNNVEALREFPFTYKVFRLSSGRYVYASILVPVELTEKFLEMSKGIVDAGVMLSASYNFHRSRANLVELINNFPSKSIEGKFKVLSKPKKAKEITREDLKILNIVQMEGSVTRDYLRSMGIRNADIKLRRLRRAGIIYRIYLPSGLGLGDQIFLHIDVSQEHFPTFVNRLSRIAPFSITYVNGTLRGIMGVIFVKQELTSDLMRLISMAYGGSLKELSLIRDIGLSGWRIPVDLWDESKQMFYFDSSWLLDKIEYAS